MSAGHTPFSALKKAVHAFFQHDVVLHHNGDGVRLLFEDRRRPVAERPKSRAEITAQKDQRDLERAREELDALLDQDATLRSTLRHLAFVEHALEKKGWRGLYKVPLDVLQKALQQLESLVSNWSPQGLASLRSRMAVAVIDREQNEQAEDAEGRKTAAVLDNPPEIAAKAIETAKATMAIPPRPPVPAPRGIEVTEVDDEAALLAAYAALGNAAPVGSIEIQGELNSPSAKSLRDAGRAGGATAP